MELCDEYIHEMIQLVPEMNDFHQLPEYKHLRPNYTNTLTKEFQKKERAIIKKYYKLVKQKQEKSFYDLVFYDDLKIMIKESKYISFEMTKRVDFVWATNFIFFFNLLYKLF